MFGKGKLSRTAKGITCCAIVVYLVIFAGIFFTTPQPEEAGTGETYGDLTGRFQSKHVLTYQGQEYSFRSGQVENILVLGVDGKRSSGKNAPLTGQADYLLLLSIDRKNKVVTPVVIDRDTMASVQLYGIFGNPAGRDVMQICLAHAFSNDTVTGGENTVQAVSRLLGGLPIDHYVTMDIAGIVLLNDAVGGVEVTLADDFTHLDPAMEKGKTMVLQGAQAELFVRGRMNLALGTNHFRVRRQTQYLSPLLEKLSGMVRSNIKEAEQLLVTLEDHLESSLSRAELLRSARAFSDYKKAPPFILQGTERLGDDRSIEFWLDWDNTAQMLVDICYERKE